MTDFVFQQLACRTVPVATYNTTHITDARYPDDESPILFNAHLGFFIIQTKQTFNKTNFHISTRLGNEGV